jgi:hypothetical protein
VEDLSGVPVAVSWKACRVLPVAVSLGKGERAELRADEWAAREGYDPVAGGGAVADEAL